jgi:hypothetical protein
MYEAQGSIPSTKKEIQGKIATGFEPIWAEMNVLAY